jgi:hypothetical protein
VTFCGTQRRAKSSLFLRKNQYNALHYFKRFNPEKICMGKKAVSTLALVLLLAACGKSEYESLQSTPTDPALRAVGAWEPDSSFASRSADGTAKVRFKITKDSFTNLVRCKFNDGSSLDVSVTAKAKVDSNTIEVLEDKTNTNTSGSKKCTASLKKGKVSYLVTGTKLELREGTNSVSFNRL